MGVGYCCCSFFCTLFCNETLEYRALQCNNNNDNDGLVNRQLIGFNIHRIKRCCQSLDRISTDNRAHQTELTAAQYIAAKSNCKDGIHFKVQTNVVNIG